jgi:xanthine dehydrogenase YagT iron-sulfur-binding subunit
MMMLFMRPERNTANLSAALKYSHRHLAVTYKSHQRVKRLRVIFSSVLALSVRCRAGGNRYNREHLMDEPTSRSRFRPEATSKPREISVTLHVNGEQRTLAVAPWTTLLDALRDRLHLNGTKKGCDHGQCGACTVLIEGWRVNSCLTLAVMKDGAHITTIEGLSADGALHPLQQAFIDHDAFQCGYCTPGQICSAAGLLAEGKAKTADEIRELMSGNICRCGAYPNIVAAIQQAMGAMGSKS